VPVASVLVATSCGCQTWLRVL